jgi:tryptophan synthase alpha subunit
VIVGSALVRLVAASHDKPRDALLADVGCFVTDLAAACG